MPRRPCLFLPVAPLFLPTLGSPPSTLSPRRPLRMVSTADPLGLPAPLRSDIDALSMVPDAKLRYQQLLFLARKLPAMDQSLKTDANRVRGCTSVVHVHVSLDSQKRVHLQGDSDAQLTKGLLALLVNGLDGATAEEVQNVDPRFIQESGLSVSLTPSRNNGFVNMLAKIKQSVARLDRGETLSDDAPENAADMEEGREMSTYDRIMGKLKSLQPVELKVVDDSAKHAGHREGGGEETHFAVRVVAEAFEPMTLVQRHRLIYTLLDEEMAGGIHALQIETLTPEEAGKQ
eukprot:GFKZ01002345.1.p1 GENE.GFKZ01002345.1~~GFKZ01002345.1.p1  ORF type:complete len:289 (-),score=34.66 GFKZ01002345.1:851-1717(-)